MKKVSTIPTLVSGAVCCFLLVLLPVSYHLSLVGEDIQSRRLSPHDSGAITSRFHVGFMDGGLWFFSHDCPYMGSLTDIVGPNTREIISSWDAAGYDFGEVRYVTNQGEVLEKKRFCTLPGVYFRHFLLHGEVASRWTLMVSLWYPILVMAVLPALWIGRRSSLRFQNS
jgi:hypothetical protein